MSRLRNRLFALASQCGASVFALVAACTGTGTGTDPALMDMTMGKTNPAPTVTAVSPPSGVNNTTTALTITGTAFRSGATVTVGGQPCTSAQVVSPTSITCTAPGMAGSCGFADIVVKHPDDGQSGTGSKLFAYVSSGVGWAAPVDHPVGNYPRRVVAIDLNADGKIDLASANQLGNSVTVRLGAGDGTFPMPQSSTLTLGGATSPNDLLAADLNGDGKMDLATANSGGGGSITILLNTGSGFAPTMISTSSGGFSSGGAIAAGDINGDTKIDLVVASSSSSSVLAMLGDGAGSFAPGLVRTVGGLTSEVALADMNSDGKLDLVTANFSTNNVSVCLGNGNGQFGLPLNRDASTRPYGLFVTDMNGDKKLDVITGNNVGNNVSILLGENTGMLAASVNISLGSSSPEAVWVADFGGDGKADIISANAQSNNWSYLQGVSPTQYANPVTTSAGTTPAGITSADVNGDGMPDVIVASAGTNNLQVTLQTCK